MNIEDLKSIRVGDFVVLNDDGRARLMNCLGEDPYFEVLVNYNGDLLIKVKCGWRTLNNYFNLDPTQYPESQELYDRFAFLRKQDLNAWWLSGGYIESVILKEKLTSVKVGVYNPMTSKVKSPEELEQYKKDFEFFFKDLTVPYEAPKDAWAKWS